MPQTKTAKRQTAAKSSGSKSTASKAGSRENGSGQMLEKFMIESLKDMYWAEKHLLKALPKMAKAATSEELRTAFEEHLEQTREHVSRLEEVFELMGKKAQGKKCEAMEGLVEEGEEVIEDTQKGSATRDVALIIAAQKVEHYEIASYGGLVQLAKTMGLTEVADMLAQTLAEEKETDQNLTYIAENDINMQAEEEDAEPED